MNFSRIFLTNLIFAPLALTASDNFADATPIEFLDSALTLSEAGTTVDATAEPGEPNHAGVTANASFWYSFTVDADRRVEIDGVPSAAGNVVMAVYTGTTLADLEVVSRYSDFSLDASSRSSEPDSEPFTQNARLNFDAVAGTTYFIAVDGENSSTGAFTLNFSTSRDPHTPLFEVIPTGADWSFYQALNGTTAFDPSDIDTDFYETWHTAAIYNGPAFSAPSPSPLSYGAIEAEPNPATIWSQPANNERNAVHYLRTTFTPTRGIQELAFEGIFDDGAIIYINGIEVTRINVNATPADPIFNTTARAANFLRPGTSTLGSERGIQYATASDLDLQAGVPVEIAVSLHNSSTTSSDLAFHLRAYATEADPEILPIVAELRTSQSTTSFILSWEALAGITYQVEENVGSLEAESWAIIATVSAPTDRVLNQPVFVNADAIFYRVRSLPPVLVE